MSTPNTCTNDSLGMLLPQYELDMLSEAERERFEAHVIHCAYCRTQLETMRQVVDVMFAEREQIVSELEARGLSFNSISRELLTTDGEPEVAETAPGLGKRTFWHDISDFLRTPWVWGPAVGVACIAAILGVIRPESESRYQRLVSFDLLSFEGTTLRGGSEAEAVFQEGIRAYEQGDVAAAIPNLKKATELDSANPDAWLYLGISYYVKKDAAHALPVLRKAVELNQDNMLAHGQWYLAQTYLLSDDPANALSLLDELGTRGGPHAQEAAALAQRVRALARE